MKLLFINFSLILFIQISKIFGATVYKNCGITYMGSFAQVYEDGYMDVTWGYRFYIDEKGYSVPKDTYFLGCDSRYKENDGRPYNPKTVDWKEGCTKLMSIINMDVYVIINGTNKSCPSDYKKIYWYNNKWNNKPQNGKRTLDETQENEVETFIDSFNKEEGVYIAEGIYRVVENAYVFCEYNQFNKLKCNEPSEQGIFKVRNDSGFVKCEGNEYVECTKIEKKGGRRRSVPWNQEDDEFKYEF